MNRTKMPIIYAIIAAVLFGASAPLSKLFLGSIEAIPMAAFLYLGSGLGLLLSRVVRRKKTSEANVSAKDLPWLAGAILAGGVAAPITLMFSLKVTPASTASLLLNFESVATTLIAIIVFKEAAGKRIWAAVGLITLASIMLSWNSSGQWGFSLGAAGIMLACVFWGIDNNLTCKISLKDPITIVTIKGLSAGSFSLVTAVVLGYRLPGLDAALYSMLLGFFCYGMSIVLFIKAMREMGSSRTSALFGTAPFIGAMLSFLLFKESQSILFYCSLPVIISGIILLLREDHEHAHIHSHTVHEHSHRHDDGHHEHTHDKAAVLENTVHSHAHTHEQVEHVHKHMPDIHHKHMHSD